MSKKRFKICGFILAVFLVNMIMSTILVKAETNFLKNGLDNLHLTDGQYMVVYIKASTNTWGTNSCQYPGKLSNTTNIIEDIIEPVEPRTIYPNYYEAMVAMNKLTSTPDRVASIIGYRNGRYGEPSRTISIIDSQYALLDLNVKKSAGERSGASFNTNVYNTNIGTGYINGTYGVDAALLNYDNNNGMAKLKISGLVGNIERLTSFYVDNVGTIQQLNYKVLPISIVKSPNYYIVEGNILYHQLSNDLSWYNCYSSKLSLGPAPTYLTSGVKYYSYDGNYFYTNLMTMLIDYKAGNYNNAVNKNDEYYNYYQYLPYRTKSSFTSNDINDYLTLVRHYSAKAVPGTTLQSNQSMLYNEGNNFIGAQNQFGANAMLSFGLAANESGWGRSDITINKNNLFGHNATDYNPGTNATAYATIKDSIDHHFDRFVSAGYVNPTDSRYFGGHLGNKASGMNVKYASDPYWAEKAVNYYYTIDRNNGLGDYGSYNIGIKNTGLSSLSVYKETNTSSSVIYTMKNKSYGVEDMPVVVLGMAPGQTINGSNIWYKIQSDAVLDTNRNMVASPLKGHTYDWNNSYGYVHSSYIKLIGADVPTISATDKTILQGSTFDALEDALAYDKVDGDITDHIQVTKNTVNTATPGVYDVGYSVTNNIGKTVSLNIKITVRSNTLPVINANNVTLLQSELYDSSNGVSATDNEDGNITSKLVITGSVDTTTVGTYPVTYSITDKDSNNVQKTINVTVNRNPNPVIRGAGNRSIEENATINLKDGITVIDAEDGDITSSLQTSGTVNTSVPGTYPITYSVTDTNSNTTTKTVNVTVTQGYQEIGGNFYLHSLNWDNNNKKINISGYLSIKNMNNTYSQTILYEYMLEDVNSGKKYTIPLERWTQGDAYPIKAVSEGSYNYTDSWFKGSVDLASVPQGDYQAYLVAKSNGKKATAIFRNMYSKTIMRKALAGNGRGYLFRTNYYIKTMPIEIFIRDGGLISSTNPPTSFDNMINSYKRLNLINSSGNAILDIKGTSYNIMGNYATNQTVERTLVFENTSTYAKTSFVLGYVDNANTGLDTISLRVPDGLDKTRAWFDKQIDISSLGAGTYSIYIRTKAGSVDDYGELNDITFRSLNKQLTINGKTYALSLNSGKRGRIELRVTQN